MAGLQTSSKNVLKNSTKAAPAPVAPAAAEEAPAVAAPVAAEAATAPKGGKVKKAGDAVVDSILGTANIDVASVDRGSFRSMSDKLKLVALLGDPSVQDSPTIKGEKYEFPSIVGYRFEALADQEVPDFGTTETFNNDRMMNAADVTKWKAVKAGEQFDLTRVEVGALLSKPEYGFQITGDADKQLRMLVMYGNLKTSAVKSAEDLPGVQLIGSGFSLKLDYDFINVLEYTPASGDREGRNKFAQGVKKLNPEFEGTKFAARAIQNAPSVSRRRSAADKQDDSVKTLKQGAAFQALLQGLSK